MKRRFSAIFALILLMTVSCGRNKGLYILQGTVHEGTDTIVVVGFDSRFENPDTIIPQNGQFTWSFRPDTVTTLLLLLPDGRRYPVFAEKDVQSQVVIPSDTGTYHISGGYCNDSYNSFCISTRGDSTLEQAVAAVDSFITRDPFSEVTPYLIYDRLVLGYHASQKTLEKVIKRMSGNMQDAPYLTALKSEFSADLPSNSYLSTLTLRDSTGTKRQFADMGAGSNYLLVCVWASWMQQPGLDARKSLDSLLDVISPKTLSIIDVSIDVNKDSWKEALTKDTLRWESFIDTEGWESRIIKGTNTKQLPSFILFSGTKRVQYQTSSRSELDQELKKTLAPRSFEREKPKNGITLTKK